MQLISPLPVNPNAVSLVKGIASITWQFHYEMPAGSILEDLEAILQRASVDPGLKSLVDPLLERVQRLREQESIDASADLFPDIKQFIRDLEPLMAPEHETVRRVYERLRNDCDLLHEIERTNSKIRIPAHLRSQAPAIQSSVPPPQLYEEMLRELELGVMVLDVENGQDPVVLLNSRYLEKLLGYQPDQMLRHSLREFLADGQAKEFRRQVRLFRLTGEMHWLGACLLCADGTSTMMDIHGGRSVGPGRYGAIVWFTSADTRIAQEQYAIQAEVHEREQEWVGGISHALLNAITTVLTEFDLRRLDGTLQNTTPAQMALIDLAEETYQNIVGHIQGLKAIEGGGKREAIDLAAFLNQHCQIRRSEGVPIIYEQDGSDAWIKGEIGRVLIATDNILKNAMEAVGDCPDPRVEVSVSHRKVDAAFLHRVGASLLYPKAVPGHYVRVRIEDNGIGIPLDKFPHIFDRYATSKTPQLSHGDRGQGWGLPRARDAVIEMRGFIYPRSQENRGSRFEIYLPRARTVPVEDPIEQESPFTFEPGKEVVLLVDDESVLLQSLERVLRYTGFAKVITATDGRDALEKYRANPSITFLVTDQKMPHMDGTSLINALRKLKPELPVLMFSASGSSFLGDSGIAFLSKPAHIADLVPAMEKAAKAVRSQKKPSRD